MKIKLLFQKATTICLVCILTIFAPATKAFAVPYITGGFAGINSYSYCSLDDRAGENYINNFNNGLQAIENYGDINYTSSYSYYGNNVTTNSLSSASPVTLFVYAGHGIAYPSYNALHVNWPYMTNVLNHSALGEGNSTINFNTTNASFYHKYIVFYSCNQLNDSNSQVKAQNILKTMHGTRLIFGFASTMYLDSREATTFTYRMGLYTSMINAFNFAAEYYQPQRTGGDTIARVVGYTQATSDKLTTSYSYAPYAESNLSSFDILSTVTVPHTGTPVYY